MRKHTFKQWFTATRPWSFPASAMPVAVTLAYLLWNGQEVNWVNGVWALLNIVVFHAAGNTWSDYFDFKNRVDAKDTFGAKFLTDGMFAPKEIFRLAMGLLVVAVMGGVALAWRTGWELLAIGAVGAAGTVLYPTLKYRAWGDVDILLTYALLPTLGTCFVATGGFSAKALLVTLSDYRSHPARQQHARRSDRPSGRHPHAGHELRTHHFRPSLPGRGTAALPHRSHLYSGGPVAVVGDAGTAIATHVDGQLQAGLALAEGRLWRDCRAGRTECQTPISL